MSRKKRIHVPGAFYYVVQHAVEGDTLFRHDAERLHFCRLIEEGIQRFDHHIHAFCLTNDTIHLVVQVHQSPLSRIMHNTTFRYTRWANQRRNREGRLFRGRYKADDVSPAELVRLVRHVHLIPVSEQLVTDPADYQWGSHRGYFGAQTTPWLTTETVLRHFSSNVEEARAAFDSYIRSAEDNRWPWVTCVERGTSRAIRAELSHHPPEARRRALSLDQIIGTVCREYRLTEQALAERGKQRIPSEARAVVAFFAHENEDLSLAEAARRLNRDPSSLSEAAAKIKKRASTDKGLADRITTLREVLLPQTDATQKIDARPTLRTALSDRGPFEFRDAAPIIEGLIDQLSGRRDTDLPLGLPPEWIVQEKRSRYVAALPSSSGKRHRDVLLNSAYLAPERRSEGSSTQKGMVWSLGALLFEMLTGRPPPASDLGREATPLASLPDIRRFRSDLPESIALFLFRILEPDPDFRLPNLSEMKRKLSALQQQLALPVGSERGQDLQVAGVSTKSTFRPLETSLKDEIGALSFGALPFVGREHELDELTEHLSSSDCRLISVLGPGGIGKSRLAHELTSRVAPSYPDGVYFIPLNPVHSSAFIPLAIGNALGLTFTGKRKPLDQLISYLEAKKTLLVLDDFDRLLEGADQVVELISRAKKVDVLVTSRERLRLKHERVYDLDGLEVPEENVRRSLRDYGSICLFRANARRLKSDYQVDEDDGHTVTAICRLLEGMPLAIELASGWIRVLSSREILNEIERGLDVLSSCERDISERHRSIRATFERSWQMLTIAEQTALMKLSVFRGGFEADAAESIAGTSLSHLSVFVDKSLVKRGVLGRYQIHELLRQYSAEKLAQDSNLLEEVRREHTRFFGRLLKQREKEIRGSEYKNAMNRIEEELGNIQEGLHWGLRSGMRGDVACYMKPLLRLYEARGWFHDGEQMFDDAATRLQRYVDKTDDLSDEGRLIAARSKAFQGFMDIALGDYSRARDLLQQCLEVVRELDSPEDAAFALRALGEVERRGGNLSAAHDLLQQSFSVARKAHLRWAEADVLADLGSNALFRGDYEQAGHHLKTGLSICDHLGYDGVMPRYYLCLGNLAYVCGLRTEAREYYERGLSIAEKIEQSPAIAALLDALGNVATVLGEDDLAKTLYEKCLVLARESGSDQRIARSLYVLASANLRLGHLDKARKDLEQGIELYRRIGDRRQTAYALISLAEVVLAQSDYATAHSLAEESVCIFREIGVPRGLAESLWILAEATRLTSTTNEAKMLLHEALAIAREVGAVPVGLGILVGWAKVFSEQGDVERAAELLSHVQSNQMSHASVREDAARLLKELAQTHGTADVRDAAARGTNRSFGELCAKLCG